MTDIVLETDSTVPTNATVTITVYQDTEGDGSGGSTDPNGKSYDNSASTTLSGGSGETNTLTGFAEDQDGAYWLEIDFSVTGATDDVGIVERAEIQTPAVPANLSASSPSEGQIDLSWDAAADADSYAVYRATASGSTLADYTQVTSGVTNTTFSDTGLSDGEEYFYRVTGENSTFESDLSNEASATTPLPAPTDLSVDDFNQDTFDLSWTDNADNEDGFRVLLSTDGGSSFSQDDGDLAANTTTYTTTVLSPDTYTIKVRAFTEHVTSDSSTITHDHLGLPVRETRATDWRVEIEHPTSSNILRPTVVGKPQRHPKSNDLPELSIPVKRSEKWQDSGLEGATMRVWFKGIRQPIDELETVDVTPSGTVLSGRGGLELETNVGEVHYDFQEIHTAAKNLIQNNVSYTANVDTPNTTTTTNQTVQSATTNTEFNDRLRQAFGDTDPLKVRNGNIELLQSAYWREGENPNGTQTGGSTVSESEYSGGSARELTDTTDDVDYDLTTEYTFPSGSVGVAYRADAEGGTNPPIDIKLNGTTLTSLSADVLADGVQWRKIEGSYGSDLGSGTHTVTFEVTGTGNGSIDLDAVVLYDTRFTYTFDNTVDANGWLSGPELYPDADTLTTFEFDNATPVDPITGARIEATLNASASGFQAALSTDYGDTFPDTSGSVPLEVDYSGREPVVRWRCRLARTDETRTTASPTDGYNGQDLQSYTLKADTEDMPMLIDQSFDGQLIEVLREFADISDFIFEYQRDGLTETVEWTQPGQRTSSKEPSVATYDVSKDTGPAVVEKARVRGASLTVRDESFTADHGTAVSLNHDHLHPARERVYDNSAVYQRGRDYTIDPPNGEITTKASGTITDGASLNIDYRYQPFNTYTASGVSSPRTETFNIPGATTDRTCGIIAKKLVQDLKDPQWNARVVVPTDEAGWSVVDEIDIAEVPTDGTALHIRDVENTPGQVVLLLETRETIQDYVSDVKNRFRGVAQKV